MRKDSNILRFFPFYFFLFLTIFISFKFVFIFFFRAAFEPQFIFELTPYYVLSGVNNLQLLFLSLAVITLNVYLHMNATKRNLTYSFLLTGIMLSGLGIAIVTKEISISNLFHYLIFGCLLFIVLIDHKHILTYPEIQIPLKKEPVERKVMRKKPVIIKAQPKVAQASAGYKPPRLSFPLVSSLFSLVKNVKKTPSEQVKEMKGEIPKHIQPISPKDEKSSMYEEKLSGLKDMSRDELRKAQIVLEELERKTKKLERLEDEVEERRKRLVEQERMFKIQLVSSIDRKSHPVPSTILDNQMVSDNAAYAEKEHPEILDNVPERTVVIQRGVLKQVDTSFAELLGYDVEELVNKSLLVLVAPEGLADVRKHYLGRLKGSGSSTYETIFATKDNSRIQVEVSVKPTIYNGEKAEIAVITEMEDKQGDETTFEMIEPEKTDDESVSEIKEGNFSEEDSAEDAKKEELNEKIKEK